MVSSTASRCSAPDSLSSSLRVAARMASGSSGSGSSHRATIAGRSLADSVSPVSAVVSLGTITISPAMAEPRGLSSAPTAAWICPIRSSLSWSALREPWPETCSTSSARIVPEKIRTIDSRPAKGSVVVRMTCATSGASGSVCGTGSSPPEGAEAAGLGCRDGVGKPCSISRSSSSTPTPVLEATGTTG